MYQWKNTSNERKVEQIWQYSYSILFWTKALLELREDIILATSSLLVGSRNIVLSHSFLRRLCEYFMLLLVVLAIEVKGLSNVIGIGHSTTIIMGEHSWCTGSYSFDRN